MRNLKKVLALCVALTMAFGLMISAAAFTDDASITNTDAVNMLTQLKIISGYPDGSFKPAGTVTRAEMAKMVYVALRRGTDDKGTAFVNAGVPLSDIGSHWAKGYVKYAYGAGIISGYPNGTFKPDGQVTGTEAAKMLLTALGYKSEVEGYVGAGWDFNIGVDAATAGLLEGIEDVDLSKPITRDNAAQMIYNALFAKLVTYDDNGNLVEGATFAEGKLGLVKLEGTLVANDQASIDTSVAGDGKYKIVGDFDDDDTDETLEIEGNADISLIGQDVTAYVKVKDGVASDDVERSSDVVKTYGNVVATPGENTVVIDYGDSFNDDNDTDSDTAFYYNYGNQQTRIIFNDDNAAYNDTDNNGRLSSDEIDDGNEVVPVQGDKTICIDNNDDGTYDIVIELAMTFDDDISIDDDDATIDGAGFDDEDIANVIGADVIEDGDAVVAYQISSTCHSDYAGGVYKCDTVEGTLKSTRGTTEAKIDSTYYKISGIDNVDGGLWNSLTDDSNFGEIVTVYLDEGGYIVDFDATGADSTPDKYCGVRDVQWETGSKFDDGAQVAVTLEDGTDAVYDVKDVGSDIAKAGYDITDEGADHAPDKDPTGEEYFVGSIFTYSLNSKNEITLKEKVASIGEDANREGLSEDALTANLSKDYGAGDSTIKLVGGTYTVRSSTVFFNYDGDDGFDVYVGKSESPKITESLVSVYDNGDYSTKTASVVLSRDTFTTGESTGNYVLVLNVESEYEDGDYHLTITGFDGTSIITLKGDDGIGMSGKYAATGVKEGAIIEYTMDGDVMSHIYPREISYNYTQTDDSFVPDTSDNHKLFFGGCAVDYSADGQYITLRKGATLKSNDDKDATFELDDDYTIGEIKDLDSDTVKATGDDVDPITSKTNIQNDYKAGEGNVIVEYDTEDDVVTAIFYLNDDTITVVP